MIFLTGKEIGWHVSVKGILLLLLDLSLTFSATGPRIWLPECRGKAGLFL